MGFALIFALCVGVAPWPPNWAELAEKACVDAESKGSKQPHAACVKQITESYKRAESGAEAVCSTTPKTPDGQWRECMAKNAVAFVKQAAEDEQSERQRLADLARVKKLGFSDVDADTGIVESIALLRRGEVTLKQLAKLAIVPGAGADAFCEVFQVLDQNNVLAHCYEGGLETVLWVKDYRKHGGKNTWMEGANLFDASWFGLYAIRGVKKYSTVIGTKQAIIIEPVGDPHPPATAEQ